MKTFRSRLFVWFFALGALLSGGLELVTWLNLRHLPEEMTQQILLTGAANAVMQIEAADVRALRSDDPARADAARTKLQKVLQAVCDAPPVFGTTRAGVRLGRYQPAFASQPDKNVQLLLPCDDPAQLEPVLSVGPLPAGQRLRIACSDAVREGLQAPAAEDSVVDDGHGPSISAYAPVRDAAGTAGLLRVRIDGVHIRQIHVFMALVAFGSIVLVVVGSAVAAIYLSGRLNHPVRVLHDAMERVASGDLAVELPPVGTGDEFEALVERFNRMTAYLREHRRMKQSLATAMEIQQHLLPQGPVQVPGFDVWGGSQYCDETGGDYYDFIDLVDLGQHQVGVAVGDVTGHGIAAALLMASARAVLRSNAAHHGQSLGELLTAMNVHLVRDTGEERFITLFYGVLNADSRTLAYASAGHDPVLWLHAADGAVDELATTGLPLGAVADSRYEQPRSVTLEAGDVLLIGTDGIWDTRNSEGTRLGRPRVKQLLQRLAPLSAREIYQAVLAAVHEFRGPCPQEDDITLVVIKAARGG